METLIIYARLPHEFDRVNILLAEGWVLTPEINRGKPLPLESAVVYHIVKYTPEELVAMQQAETEGEAQIISIKSVSIDEADALLSQGYTIQDTYAKTVTLIKYKETDNAKQR